MGRSSFRSQVDGRDRLMKLGHAKDADADIRVLDSKQMAQRLACVAAQGIDTPEDTFPHVSVVGTES